MNDTTVNVGDPIPLERHPRNFLYWFNFIFALLIIIVGGPGNLLTIVAIAVKKELRTAFNLLIAVIAVADALATLAAVPLHFDAILTRLPHSLSLCQAELFVGSFSLNVSLFLIPAIACIRLHAVRSGALFKLKWRVAVTIMAVSTVLAVVIAVYAAFFSPLLTPMSCLANNRLLNTTAEDNAANKGQINPIYGMIIGTLVSAVSVYMAMAKYIKTKRQAMIVHPMTVPTMANQVNIATLRTVIAVVGTFCISCVCPVTHAMIFINSYQSRLNMDPIDRSMAVTSASFTIKTFLYSQSALNWIVYTVASKRYRDILKSTCKWKDGQRPDPISSVAGRTTTSTV